MSITIGILLPRSTDYPAMGFDLTDGLRARLGKTVENVRIVPESIGFGENRKDTYAKAEKLLMQDNADIVVAYLSAINAELLYPLFEAAGKPLIVMDPGMNYPTVPASNQCIFISLQGLHSSYLSGEKSGEKQGEVLLATSFYDGGYRGPWAATCGIRKSGGAVTNNFVGHYKESEFTIAPFLQGANAQPSIHVAACFSTYLAATFMNSLSAHNDALPELVYHCSSFMAEEQTLATYDVPKGKFFSFMPWATVVENEQNTAFMTEIKKVKNKQANIFHLLGWEAGIVAEKILRDPAGPEAALRELTNGWEYESPRGTVKIHPETRITYAPLYFTGITGKRDASDRLRILETYTVGPEEHLRILREQPEGTSSGWFNNYLCS